MEVVVHSTFRTPYYCEEQAVSAVAFNRIALASLAFSEGEAETQADEDAARQPAKRTSKTWTMGEPAAYGS